MIPAGGAALIARGPASLIEFGGMPVSERLLWWNFLATDKTLIDAAKLRWALGDFPMPPGDRDDWTPLPADHERPLRLRSARKR